MRKVILIIVVSLVATFGSVAQDFSNEFETDVHWETLIEAMAWNESRHDSTVVSKSGTYVGYLQIGPQYLKCANEAVGYVKWTREDCFSRLKSIEIFNEVNRKHNPRKSAERALKLHTGEGYKEWHNYRRRIKDNYIRLRNEQKKQETEIHRSPRRAEDDVRRLEEIARRCQASRA